jgi:hypothetical protein
VTFVRRSDPPKPPPRFWSVDLAFDADRDRWTAFVEAWGASGVGPTPGAAVDDLFGAVGDLIAVIDALREAGGLTVEWKTRRDALVVAAAVLKKGGRS